MANDGHHLVTQTHLCWWWYYSGNITKIKRLHNIVLPFFICVL